MNARVHKTTACVHETTVRVHETTARVHERTARVQETSARVYKTMLVARRCTEDASAALNVQTACTGRVGVEERDECREWDVSRKSEPSINFGKSGFPQVTLGHILPRGVPRTQRK